MSELGITVPPFTEIGKWRIGKPSEKLGSTLFMRIASRYDVGSSRDGGRNGSGGMGDVNRDKLGSEALLMKNKQLSEFSLRILAILGFVRVWARQISFN